MEQLSLVWLIARRELRDQFRDWRIIFPMIVLTIFFPFLMNFTAREVLDFVSQYGANLIGERLVPFLLMVVGFFPITVSLVIALEAFVGEKERGTIEPLLSSPLKDWQLYLGKLIAATSVPLLAAYLGISVYLIGLRVQHIPFPDLGLLVQTITLTSVQAVLMVSGAIVISTQATSVRAANLMSSFVVIPMALLIQGES
ncbi:MAG: ABC transporter permease subunit, partial [Anaerolineales bacterium]|nr:ABC transporter permease subunit [Anaerolineales bacterium]